MLSAAAPKVGVAKHLACSLGCSRYKNRLNNKNTATVQEQSNVRFLLGARIQDPTADILTFTFQRDVLGKDLYSLQVPRQLFQKLGGQGFIDYIADYNLEEQPAEATRIDRGYVVFALTYGIDYCRLDDAAAA